MTTILSFMDTSLMMLPNQEDENHSIIDGYTIDDAALIALIHNNKPLWSLSSNLYKNTQLKDAIWLKFEKQMDIPAATLQKRWINLKKGYSREKAKRKVENKSGYAGPAKKKKRPGFAHYEAMQFLETNSKLTQQAGKFKKDPLTDMMVNLSNVFEESLKNDNEKNEKKSLHSIPVEDELFGKTVAAELAKIQDVAIKQNKKALIMNAIYS